MMAKRCRDCPRCTEVGIVTLFMIPFRLAWDLLTCWNIGLFRRRCPQCRHWLGIHQKVGGRFAD
jgi:hypothetical protein